MDNISNQTPVTQAKAKTPISPDVLAKIDEQAQHFEGMFMTQMMQFMWTGLDKDNMFGGGHAEETWRGMLLQEYGTISAKAGNLGIADAVKAELIKLQEKMQPAVQTTSTENGDNV